MIALAVSIPLLLVGIAIAAIVLRRRQRSRRRGHVTDIRDELDVWPNPAARLVTTSSTGGSQQDLTPQTDLPPPSAYSNNITPYTDDVKQDPSSSGPLEGFGRELDHTAPSQVSSSVSLLPRIQLEAAEGRPSPGDWEVGSNGEIVFQHRDGGVVQEVPPPYIHRGASGGAMSLASPE